MITTVASSLNSPAAASVDLSDSGSGRLWAATDRTVIAGNTVSWLVGFLGRRGCEVNIVMLPFRFGELALLPFDKGHFSFGAGNSVFERGAPETS